MDRFLRVEDVLHALPGVEDEVFEGGGAGICGGLRQEVGGCGREGGGRGRCCWFWLLEGEGGRYRLLAVSPGSGGEAAREAAGGEGGGGGGAAGGGAEGALYGGAGEHGVSGARVRGRQKIKLAHPPPHSAISHNAALQYRISLLARACIVAVHYLLLATMSPFLPALRSGKHRRPPRRHRATAHTHQPPGPPRSDPHSHSVRTPARLF